MGVTRRLHHWSDSLLSRKQSYSRGPVDSGISRIVSLSQSTIC